MQAALPGRFTQQQRSSSHVCPQCGKHLSCEANLRLHINNHLGVFKFHCDICSKGFQQKLHLLAHMASSHNIESLKSKCPVCEKTFSREDKMKTHLKLIHQGWTSTAPPKRWNYSAMLGLQIYNLKSTSSWLYYNFSYSWSNLTPQYHQYLLFNNWFCVNVDSITFSICFN